MTYICMHCGKKIPRDEIDDSKPIINSRVECDNCLKEIDFFEDELKASVKENNLEEAFKEFNVAMNTVNQMIKKGNIQRTQKDIGNTLDILFQDNPPLQSHYKKIVNLIITGVLKEQKQSRIIN